uniref:PI3K/PI4K catalytic domain-containing protein n=1 Tax=Macrostomum lignano TaxID=282301 RepID=A0A1I8HGE9_9PLAT
HNLEEFDLLFQLLRCYLDSSVCNFHFFTSFLSEQCQTASPAWKRAVFLKFRDIHKDRAWASQVQLKCKILQYVVIPSVSYSFDNGQQEALIGGPPEPDSASGDNMVAVFVRDFLTDATTPEPDALRVLILQLACVFVEKASPWIHDANNKRQQGVALHRLMTYAWPCQPERHRPLAKFHGHLLLAHIIAKFAINKRIVVQVFHGLLKSFQPEPKRVVTAALDILTPVMTSRLEDDPSILQHWTKKILLEDTAAGSTQNYQHILSLIVRHHDVYYAIRHSLMTNILQGLSKFGLASNNVSAEHRKLALELIETVMKWDLRQRTEAEAQRNQPQQSSQQEQQLQLEDTQSSSCDTKSLMSPSSSSSSPLPAKRARLSATSTAAAASAAAASAVSSASSTLSGDQQPSVLNTLALGSATSAAGAAAAAAAASKPFDKCTKDQIVYALMRFAVYIVDGNVNNLGNELWTKRPIQLIQTLLSPEWWPDTDLKLSFFDRILNVPLETRGANSVQTAQMNASLEVLRVLFDHLDRSALLTSMRLLSKGLCNCLRQASNPRAVKLMGPIVTRVFSLFPPESDQLNQFTKHSELVEFYMTIYKAILDGFSHYERTSVTNSPATAQLFASIMLLKATQADGNYVIVDRVITHFGKLLNRMAKETFNATATDTGAYMTEMLITSFDIVKCRLNSMSVDTRRSFLQLLLHLIEKSSDTKLLKAIVSLIREWICVTRPEDQASAPVPKERCQLLMKVMSNISNSRIRDEDIIDEFLEAVYTVYSVPYYKNQEMFGKLEQAFCMGVDSGKPAIRNKFMRVYMSEVFEGPHANSLQSRLLFIVASHRWDKMGSCFWIPIAFEIFVRAALPEARVRLAQPGRYLGGAATGAESASSSSGPVVKQEAGLESEFAALAESDAKLFYCDQQDSVTGAPSTEADSKDDSKVADDDDMTGANAAQESLFPYEDPARLGTLLARDAQVMSELSDVTNALLLDGMAALCYVDHQLADSLFVSTFPKLWSLITESTTSAPGGQDVSRQLIPYVRKFIASGIHSHQMDVHPSSLRTFVSGVTKCPDITRTIPHPVLCYLGSQFHMWHECTLLLEHYYYGNSRVKRGAFETASSSAAVSTGSAGEFASDYEEGLLQIYSEMREEDYLAAIWSVRAPCEEMVKAVSYAQFGLFQQAVEAGEDALDRKFSNPTDAIMKDRFIEEHYLSYLRQLNRWAELPRFAQAFNCCNHRLVAECDWKLSDWRNMHNALSQLGNEYPRRDKWRIELLWGYWHLCGKARSDHADYVSPTLPQHVERFFKTIEWRRLPALVSAVHVPYLQATQQVMELHEASGIYATLNNVSYGRTPVTTTSLIHDMKSIIKTWKNRVPVIMDDLTHWHEVIQWRQHLFHEVHRTVSSSFVQDNPMQNHLKMIALHSFVTAMIQFAKWKNYKPTNTTWPNPATLKIKQDFKSRLDIVDSRKENILEAVEFMEKTSIKFFNAMEKAEFFSYKRRDEANKNFSMAIQLNDTVYRVWMHYGDFLEHDAPSRRDQNAILNGTYAIQCFMEAAKAQSECKARRPIAKSIWLLSFDDATGSLAKCFEERTANVQPSHFLAWINNLLVALLGLCAALKAEPNSQQPLWRCSNVLHRAKDFHAATLNAYEALCDGLSSLSLDWQHNALNQLRRLFDSAVSAAAAAADTDSSDMPIPTEVSALLTEMLKDFGGVEELRSELSSDPELQPATGSLQSAIRCLSRKWLPTIESRARRLPRAFLLADRAPPLANFVAPALADPSAELELPGEQLDGKPVQHWVKVHSVLPSVRVLLRNGCAVRCVQLRGTNGRVYSYLLEQDSASSATPPPALASWREASVGHLTRLINWILAKEKEPARRLLQAAAPKCVDLGGGHRLTEDSGRPLSLLDAHRAANPAPEPDRPLVRWLLDRRLATTAAQLPARDLLEELIGDVGPDLLLKRCLAELAGPSEFFTFRRVVTGQLGLLGLLEMTLGLEKAGPDRLLLQLDTGRASVTRQVWSSSVAATAGSFASQAADSQPPTAVPFRLTPNLCELISPLGIRGPLQAAIIASARCLVLPKYQLAAYLRCVLRDEVILTYRQANGGACPEADALTQSVGQAVSAILARLQALAAFEGRVVPDYVKAASDLDNLAAMPAAYQPWL